MNVLITILRISDVVISSIANKLFTPSESTKGIKYFVNVDKNPQKFKFIIFKAIMYRKTPKNEAIEILIT